MWTLSECQTASWISEVRYWKSCHRQRARLITGFPMFHIWNIFVDRLSDWQLEVWYIGDVIDKLPDLWARFLRFNNIREVINGRVQNCELTPWNVGYLERYLERCRWQVAKFPTRCSGSGFRVGFCNPRRPLNNK